MKLSYSILAIYSILGGVLCINSPTQDIEEVGLISTKKLIDLDLIRKKMIFYYLNQAKEDSSTSCLIQFGGIENGTYVRTSHSSHLHFNLELDPTFSSVIEWYRREITFYH